MPSRGFHPRWVVTEAPLRSLKARLGGGSLSFLEHRVERFDYSGLFLPLRSGSLGTIACVSSPNRGIFRPRRQCMSSTYKLVELVGTSPESFAEATRAAIEEASKTIRHMDWVQEDCRLLAAH